ncbi:glycosyltransferase [Aurantiacibacter rhizosphaerae]|uniref:Glycosyltransferase n=1 Tax=Aurantiacibacter rhizosphaerae TaxID=2691582 RepID=A0A844XFQ9_9SPHN|nr:glycosyltransferase [Aurantiacibacter rhizosphaerae]MWV29461.1 glycosyltransferase [Aurantiacibacter rhizosphaerae]
MRVVLLGTYDLGKPRTRLLRDCLRAIDPGLQELHFSVWHGVEDKSVMSGLGGKLRIAMRLLLAYPVVAARYLMAGRHDIVVIGYMGLFDMVLLAPLAKLRGKPVVWDAFLSIYDTYVRDRAMASERGWKARFLGWIERRACAIADKVVLDTRAHAGLMGDLHGVPEAKLDAVFVGAESSAFAPAKTATTRSPDKPVEVLFYGQFIPLHGIDTIIDAALDPRGRQFRWTIVGQGQEAARIDARLQGEELSHITRIAWVDYEKLAALMECADICLGIFGTSDKAARVIPNKVYQALAASKPLITRDSPAMRELVQGERRGLYLVPPADPSSVLDALDLFVQERADFPPGLHGDLREAFASEALTEQWRAILVKAATQ